MKEEYSMGMSNTPCQCKPLCGNYCEEECLTLFTIVTSFRDGILNGRDPKGLCLTISYPLASYLALCGYENRIERGDVVVKSEKHDHYWLVLGNIIVDPTASQFSKPNKKKMPPVYIGELPDWYVPDSYEKGETR